MAGDSIEPTRRKHHRSSSPDDAEEQSKRRKHRHHHRHRHRHRSSKEKAETTKLEELEGDRIDDTEVELMKLESTTENGVGSLSEVPVNRNDFSGFDYEMEEGEIVEDDGLVDFVNDDSDKFKKNSHLDVGFGDIKKNPQSDVEFREIKTNGCDDFNMGFNGDSLETVDRKFQKLGKDKTDSKESGEIDQERLSNSVSLANGGYEHKYQEVDSTRFSRDDKQIHNFADEVDRTGLRKSSSSEKVPGAGSNSHETHLKERSYSNLLRSPELSRGRSRSRSRSIVREASVEDPYCRERKHRSGSDDERTARDAKLYRHSCRDIKDKERERSPSSRYTERVERHREARDPYREGSRDRDWDRDRDRIRDKGRKEEDIVRDRERNRLRDRYRGERGQERVSGRERERERERDRDRDHVREDYIRDRERDRQGVGDDRRARSRDNDIDRLSRCQKYEKGEDAHKDRYNETRHRRNYEDYHTENTGSDFENERSKDKEGNEKLERDLDRQEDYQEKIAVQLAEQEEDDLERIKEESRRRRQAILEKYKNKQQKSETHLQVVDAVVDTLAQVASAELLPENSDNQTEGVDDYVPEPSFAVGKLPSQNGVSTVEMPTGTGGLGEGTPKSERSNDMFCDDIFGESPAGIRKTGKGDGIAVEKSGLNDNWDDAEGYYGYRFGEVLDGRYEIIASHGKGVFSTVVRAKDLKAKPGDTDEVAIKIIRNNETMYKAGMEELVILKKLAGADPESKRHCVRFLSTFKYRNHLCLVFESLHMNLREVLKKFGRNIGLKLTAVRAYAKQLFIALKHLKNCGVLHCDIKPDNMLVNEAKNVLKLCDFGNAMFAGKNEITPYLVSRFYRAPEIILGLSYDLPMDIWSVGCCLFELYTGKVLFPGATNNDMLRLHMELKGPFPKKMLRKGAFTDQHFDQDLNFLATDEDPVSKKPIRRLLVNIKPKDFGTLISGSPGEDPKMVANFRDLMEKIFVLDPDKRLNVSQALGHPFITGK
ncbi:serine/threonine-protein kinase prpf4B-like isoform X1 [Salvia splendens]|uniref:serine/threonine-protein kinase prpf4B-like isoform X1 n=1 Tax=Salvia splendens TaxID=180675 RepID=UPI001C27E8CD|nr:serine/threonine-protein kinase prpf4B-like isoform X1 [Salvia splendens]